AMMHTRRQLPSLTAFASLCAVGFLATAETAGAQAPATWSVAPGAPDAHHSDPRALGIMQGTPPAPDKRVRFSDGSAMSFPGVRWSTNHWRELYPTKNVSRGDGPVLALPRAERRLDDLTFKTMT